MDTSNPENMVKTAVGVAGGSVLFAPVAVPTLHGLAGVAVVGLGIFAVGSLALKAAGALGEIGRSINPNRKGSPGS